MTLSSAARTRLRAPEGDGRHACVIGWPIEHSRSPLIHGHWLEKYGIPGTYSKLAVAPDELADFLASLADLGYAGCNVTVPHKEGAYRAAALHEPSADAVAAANTIWLQDGEVAAANTDTFGFMTHLDLSAPAWRSAGGTVALLGAGGAARAIAYGFLCAGVDEVVVFNRTRERAEALARDLGDGRIRAADWEERKAAPRWASVIVNTTTIGMKGDDDLGVDFSSAREECVVADIVYVPLETGLLRDAAAAGLATVDGLGMLLHQAVPGFEKWFGRRPEVTPELRSIILRDLGAA